MSNRRFILIDHSIRGYGGHHYEYAVHVLSAAREAGFETILAVNRAFDASTDTAGGDAPPWRIVPVYEHGFWRTVAPRARPPANADDWRRRMFERRLRFKYGKWGEALAMLPLFRRHYTPATIMQDARSRSQLVLMLLGLLVLKWPYNILASLVYLVRVIVDPLEEYLIKVGQAVWHLLLMVFYPVRIVKHLGLFSRRGCAADRGTAEFARDTAALFDQVGYREGDVVFVPTLSDRDLVGLQKFLSGHPPAHRATWHLLFRRDLVDAESRRGAAPPAIGGKAVRAFRRFAEHANGADVRFYTDTDRLTEEYGQMGVARFTTLPIPINPRFSQRSDSSGASRRPLKVVYAGDARVEKGYHILPEIVRDLHRNGHADDVQFRIQSNFAHARPQDATIERLARTELSLYPSDRVELIGAPLDSAGYHDLVASADIVLVLYDEANYYARSSGILVEALAAGIPVVAPADSWMGQQLAEATYAHLFDRLGAADVVSRWRAGEVNRGGATEWVITRPDKATGVYLTVDRPAERQSAAIMEVELRGPGRAATVTRRMLHHVADRPRCIALIALEPGIEATAVRLRDAAGGAAIGPMGLEAAFVSDDPIGLMPEAVGRAYLPGESVSEHLRQIVEHYEHYRATACRHAAVWNERHSAARLVRELVS
jgi:glycosyltransferase involved in cell wall biosynthesis